MAHSAFPTSLTFPTAASCSDLSLSASCQCHAHFIFTLVMSTPLSTRLQISVPHHVAWQEVAPDFKVCLFIYLFFLLAFYYILFLTFTIHCSVFCLQSFFFQNYRRQYTFNIIIIIIFSSFFAFLWFESFEINPSLLLIFVSPNLEQTEYLNSFLMGT